MQAVHSGSRPNHEIGAIRQPSNGTAHLDPQHRHDLTQEFFRILMDRRQLQAEIKEPIEPPKNSQPTKSGTFKWLGFGVALGTTASVVASTLGFAAAVSYLWNDTSLGFLVGTAAYLAVSAGLKLRDMTKHHKLAAEVYREDRHELRRVRSATNTLAAEHHRTPPEVCGTNLIQSLGLFDRIGKTNKLLVNSDLSQILSQRQLNGIIAHELSHSDRLLNGISVFVRGVTLAAAPLVMFTVLHLTFQHMSLSGWSGFAASGCAAIMGLCATTIFSTLTEALANIASRANEIRTDIRAVEMTQDLNGFISALQKVYKFVHRDYSPVMKNLQAIAKHPPFEKRVQWLKKACGNC